MSDAANPDRSTCERAVSLLNEYLDRELSPADEAAVRCHLEVCEACSDRFAFEGKLLATIRAKSQSARAPAPLRRRIADLLDRL
jgi:anti-sigma factor (TIGR02949 family)